MSETTTCRCLKVIDLPDGPGGLPFDKHGYYIECPECHRHIHLHRKPVVPQSRGKVHMSKKERIRRRWAGVEHLRFARATPEKRGEKGGI